MKRYKYQALIRLLPQPGSAPGAALPGPACRAVIRARHHETRSCKLFSALVTAGDDSPLPGNSRLTVTMVVLGDDADDYLAIGDNFVIWRGCDVARGVVTRRIFA